MLDLDQFYNSDIYRVRFVGPYGNATSWMIAPIQLSTTSTWASMADAQSMGGIPEAGIQKFTGRSTGVSYFAIQNWMGSEIITITFEVGFVALRNAFNEVVVPVREMLKFPLPPTLENPLTPPANAFVKDKTFTVIGKYFEIDDLLPVTVQPQFSKVHSDTGHPISATVGLTFQTARTKSQQDIHVWWK